MQWSQAAKRVGIAKEYRVSNQSQQLKSPTTKKFRYVGACLCLDTLYVEVGTETAAVLHLVDAFSKYSLILVKVGGDTTGQDTVELLFVRK